MVKVSGNTGSASSEGSSDRDVASQSMIHQQRLNGRGQTQKHSRLDARNQLFDI